MLSDKKYGLSVSVMATRVMPSLLPQTVNPSLNLEQFTILLEVGFHSIFNMIIFMIMMMVYIFLRGNIYYLFMGIMEIFFN